MAIPLLRRRKQRPGNLEPVNRRPNHRIQRTVNLREIQGFGSAYRVWRLDDGGLCVEVCHYNQNELRAQKRYSESHSSSVQWYRRYRNQAASINVSAIKYARELVQTFEDEFQSGQVSFCFVSLGEPGCGCDESEKTRETDFGPVEVDLCDNKGPDEIEGEQDSSAEGEILSRLKDLRQFYFLLDQLEEKVGGRRTLSGCNGRMEWPCRGVYFFFEAGEERSNSGKGLRVVRVGTHAINRAKPGSTGAGTKLWGRLRQHRGNADLKSGNHRGSIFRLLVGEALYVKQGSTSETWGKGLTLKEAAELTGIPSEEIERTEKPMESKVCEVLGAMPFIWLKVDDERGPNSDRAYIERNSIGLLSNFGCHPMYPRSDKWLGLKSSCKKVRKSGLWVSKFVDQGYEQAFLTKLERLVNNVSRGKKEIESRRRRDKLEAGGHRGHPSTDIQGYEKTLVLLNPEGLRNRSSCLPPSA